MSAASDLFLPVTARTKASRAARRGSWTAASTAVQALLVVGLATVSSPLVQPERMVVVPVKMIRTAPPAARPGPPPPPAALAPRPPAAPRPQPTVRRAPSALIQPREVPPELKAPDPSEPKEEEYYGDGDGNGVIGGVAGALEPEPVISAAPPPPTPQRPVKFQSTMTPPVLIQGPPLEYTQAALEREIEGTMIVECVVETDGAVHGCKTVRSLPFLDQAAIANLQRRRYRPATLEGRPLAVTYTFTLKFTLPQ